MRSGTLLIMAQGLQCRAASQIQSQAEGPAVRAHATPFLELYLRYGLRDSGIREEHNASWFSHANTQANHSREQLAHDSLEMLIQWLKEGGNVGIHG